MSSAPAADHRTLAKHKRPDVPVAPLALAAYLAFALFVTWPWAADPGTNVYGVVGGDESAGIATFQQWAENRQIPWLPGRVPDLNAPEGLPTDWPLQLLAFGSSTTLWLLSLAFGSVAAHGIVTVLGFTLSAFAMFLLLRRVIGHAGVAFVVGFVFGFWPFMYGTGNTWPQYIHLWVYPLVLWRMLVVAEHPTVRNGLWAAGAAVVAMTWIQYNLILVAVTLGTLAVVGVTGSFADGRLLAQLRAQAVIFAIVLATVAGLATAVTLGDLRGLSQLPERTVVDVYNTSARPLMYLVPGPRHLIFGDTMGEWVKEKYKGVGASDTASYAEIYLGIAFLLAGLAGLAWTLSRVRRQPRQALSGGPVTAGVTATALALVGFAFSAPPTVQVLGLTIPMPYALVIEVTTIFRAAHRFSILVMLGLCVLAALALRGGLAGRSRGVQTAALAAVWLLFAVDGWARPSPTYHDRVTAPHIYDRLRTLPQGIVAEYPMGPDLNVNDLSLYQDVHEHPTFGMFFEDSPGWSRKNELQFLTLERTVPDLAAYGVRYVTVLAGYDRPHVPEPGAAVPGLRLLERDPYGALYEVVDRGSSTRTYGLSGMHGAETDKSSFYRWLSEQDAGLEVVAPCRPCSGTLSFRSGTFARPRTLTVRDPDGRVVARRRIRSENQLVRIPLQFEGRTVLTLSADPPPERIDALVGGDDTRSVSVFVGQPVRFVARSRDEPAG